MKFLILFLVIVSSVTVFAAPKSKVAPKVRWEYAFIKDGSAPPNEPGRPGLGVKLLLQKRAPVFLSYPQGSNTEVFLLDVFSRLGAQGWELVTSPGCASVSGQYIFKRRK